MKQAYNKPGMSIVLVEPATMLALSDGQSFSLGGNDEKVDQMAGERNSNRGWGDLWND